MSDVPRRTLSELAFIYDREPDRRDVYVEGTFDAAVLSWFFRECDLQGVAIYPISSIEIPDGELIKAKRKTNNRERVVFLAAFLISKGVRHAACVVDADFSRLLGKKPVKPPLYETDYACMEMYFYCCSSFRKFLTLCCQRNDWPVETIMDSLASVLQEFFLYRCVNEELGWHMEWLDRIVCMNVEGWAINFDSDSFIARLLNKNRRLGDNATFISSVNTLRPKIHADPRHQMNGHDLTSLLSWYIRKKGISGPRAQVENVLVCMTMTLDHQTLKQEPMFHRLAMRFA